MKTSSHYSRQNCTQCAPLHCAERSRENLKRPFKYFSFAKQALSGKEAKGNWDDLGLIFLGDRILLGHGGTLLLPKLLLEQTVKHIFNIFVFACLISSPRTLGGISPGPPGSLCFLASKKQWLIYTVTCVRCQLSGKWSVEWPCAGKEGAFYFSKVFLVKLILVPGAHKSERLCTGILVWCREPETSFKDFRRFEESFRTLWKEWLTVALGKPGGSPGPAALSPPPAGLWLHLGSHILQILRTAWHGVWAWPRFIRLTLKHLGVILGATSKQWQNHNVLGRANIYLNCAFSKVTQQVCLPGKRFICEDGGGGWALVCPTYAQNVLTVAGVRK